MTSRAGEKAVDWSGRVLRQEVIFMVQDDGLVGLDRVDVVFDDSRAVSDAGIVLVVALAARSGIEASRRASCGSVSGSGRPTPGAR
jgi:hypothetical protein